MGQEALGPLLLDGVYTAASPWARPVFHPAPELEDEDVAHMVQTLRLRINRLLRRRGFLPLPGHDDIPPEPDSLLPLSPPHRSRAA